MQLREQVYLEASINHETKWSQHFSWLVFGKTKDGFPYVKCSICMSYAKGNTRYAMQGDDGGRNATAPAATADSTARSQWQTRDAHARFAIRNSLPIDEREHFGQHKTAQALYTTVVARYSSPASAALGRLSLPYLFPDLASFHTVADLITHLRTSEARFRAAMPDEFLAKNPPPLWLTLYHLVTRLPDTLRSVRDHVLARCPTELTIALLEKDLLAAEASIVAVGASRGDPRTPFFEGCSLGLAPTQEPLLE
ncbi:unnamed protein product [Closterium sp. NIES-54]